MCFQSFNTNLKFEYQMLNKNISNYLIQNISIFEVVYSHWIENPSQFSVHVFEIEKDYLEIEHWNEIESQFKNFVFDINLIVTIAQQVSSNETFLNTLQRLKFDKLMSQNTDNQIIIKYYSFLNHIFELDFEHKKGNV